MDKMKRLRKSVKSQETVILIDTYYELRNKPEYDLAVEAIKLELIDRKVFGSVSEAKTPPEDLIRINK